MYTRITQPPLPVLRVTDCVAVLHSTPFHCSTRSWNWHLQSIHDKVWLPCAGVTFDQLIGQREDVRTMRKGVFLQRLIRTKPQLSTGCWKSGNIIMTFLINEPFYLIRFCSNYLTNEVPECSIRCVRSWAFLFISLYRLILIATVLVN